MSKKSKKWHDPLGEFVKANRRGEYQARNKITTVMNLELRNKEGFFLVAFKGQMADPVFKFLLNEPKLTLTIKTIKGENDPCRVFVNNTNESIAGKNELVEFFIRPGYYVKILDV